jgi:hypothetical protein
MSASPQELPSQVEAAVPGDYDLGAHRARVMELGHSIIEAAISDPNPQYATGFAVGVLPDGGGVMIGRSRRFSASTFSLAETDEGLTVHSYLRRPSPAKNQAQIRSVVSVVKPDNDMHLGSAAEVVSPLLPTEMELSILDVTSEPYSLFDLEKEMVQLKELMVHRKRGLFDRLPASQAS